MERSAGLSSAKTRALVPIFSAARSRADWPPCRSSWPGSRKCRPAAAPFRYASENLLGDVFLVLAAHGQDHAPLLQALDVLLEGHVGFAFGLALAQADALEAVVADHAAPERIVQVQHQALLAQAQVGRHQRGHAMGIIDQVLRGHGSLAW